MQGSRPRVRDSGLQLVLPAHRVGRTTARDKGEPTVPSALALEKIVHAKGETVGLLAGDLNSQLSGQVLPIFLRSWTNSNGLKPLPTVPVKEPKRQIDFVLYRPQQRWRLKSVKVLEEQVASDHRAILSVLELLPASR